MTYMPIRLSHDDRHVKLTITADTGNQVTAALDPQQTCDLIDALAATLVHLGHYQRLGSEVDTAVRGDSDNGDDPGLES